MNILTNYTYRNLKVTEKSVVQYYEIIDRNYSLMHFLNNVPEYLSSSVKELNTDLVNFNKAVSALSSLEKKNEAAKVKGAEVDLGAVSELQDQLRINEDKLASRIAAKESFIEKYQFLIDEFADDTEYLLRLITDEAASNETFAKLTKGSEWDWDRSIMLRELEMGYKNNLDLAGYVIGRIYQTEGDLVSASKYLDTLTESETILEDVPFAVFQNNLWLGDKENITEIYNKYSEEIVSYDQYLYGIVDYIEYLSLEDDEIFGFLTDDPSGSVKSVITEFSNIKSDIREVQSDVQKNIISIHNILEEKMLQGFYRLAEQTYLLRNELGDFYQKEDKFPEAIEQYKQVLKIDPWNLSAKYKLGQVYQWNGNWQKALDLYEEVYNEDPVFGNVTLFYNQLAREHADRFNFSGTTIADPSKLIFKSHASYSTNIYGIFSAGFDYNVSNNRDYILGTSFLLHDLSFYLPIDLSLFVLSPMGGMYAYSDLVNDTFTGTPDIGDFLSAYNLYPYAGVSMSLWKGSFGLYSAYQYSWEEDSFKPGTGGSPVSYQKGELSAQVDFNFTQLPVLKETSSFISGFSRYLSDGNMIFGGSFEMLNEVKINKDPDISLNIAARVIYEDSSKGSRIEYWAPENSLTAGGGIEASAEFSIDNNASIGDTLGFSVNYFSDILDSGIDFTLGNIFEYTNGNFDGYIKLEGTMRDTMDYWSLSISIGSSSSLPELLSL